MLSFLSLLVIVSCCLILVVTFEACRRAGIVAVSARQLKPIEKLKLKLTTKGQIEFGQARYLLIVAQLMIVFRQPALRQNFCWQHGLMFMNTYYEYLQLRLSSQLYYSLCNYM